MEFFILSVNMYLRQWMGCIGIKQSVNETLINEKDELVSKVWTCVDHSFSVALQFIVGKQSLSTVEQSENRGVQTAPFTLKMFTLQQRLLLFSSG